MYINRDKLPTLGQDLKNFLFLISIVQVTRVFFDKMKGKIKFFIVELEGY